ncbi:MAG: gamma-glutamyl-gamma-aminobutyrate hydrolase family protein [Bacilli bacterium]|nr:gamma-glutamyl-gamma-aminobutyrate hydrolase family protein [Bacilli bacterium]
MSKPIIGIVSPRHTSNDPFDDFTGFTGNFPKRIIEAGGVPIGLLCPFGKFNYEAVSLCDGFLFQGGSLIESCQLNIMHYAVMHEKPILGICLGAQTMAGYEWISNQFADTLTYDLIDNFFRPEYEDYFLERAVGHNNLDPFIVEHIEDSKHGVMFEPNSKVAEAFGDSYVLVPSIHNFIISDSSFVFNRHFKVSGRSSDGVIEAIESTSDVWQVGVQFHPEIESKNKVLFKKFVSECRKNR